jgi:2-iminobutanoate/2-iminopropanoate deaminase
MMKFTQTDKAPAAIGPYSQAVVVDGMVYTSGQIALLPDGNEDLLKDGGVAPQAKQVLENLKAVLEASDSSMDKVLKTTIFLSCMDDFTTVNEIYAEAFGDHKPVRSTVAVKTLPKNALVEIDAVAIM